MHFIIIIVALGLAWTVRLASFPLRGTWSNRWLRSLFCFLFPPLLLLMTSVAVILMGTQGQMFGVPAGWFSYWLAITFVFIAFILLLKLTYQAWQTIVKVRTYPQQFVLGERVRMLDLTFPYSAQIGLWQPELVISQGLLNTLDSEHLKAVIAHEKAHANYRDTFCFFWLGWLRNLTVCLPNTQQLWQELLLLREIRADRQATQQIDPLLLAESLLIVTQSIQQNPNLNQSESFCVAFHDTLPTNRLTERIEALLTETEFCNFKYWSFTYFLLSLVPLIFIHWHY